MNYGQATFQQTPIVCSLQPHTNSTLHQQDYGAVSSVAGTLKSAPAGTAGRRPESDQLNPTPYASHQFPNKVGRPATLRHYLAVFSSVVEAYVSCLEYRAIALYARSSKERNPSSLMPTVIEFIVDVERSASQVLDTPDLCLAWQVIVGRYKGSGYCEAVPIDVQHDLILALGTHWEYLGLYKVEEYFSRSRSGTDNRRGVAGLTERGRSRRRETSPEYRAWQNMNARCNYPKCKRYDCWGGRGIRVAAEFLVFEAFFLEVGLRPGPGYSLDRIDNDGDYAPGNVRWAQQTEQNRNRRPRSLWPGNKRKPAARDIATASRLEVAI